MTATDADNFTMEIENEFETDETFDALFYDGQSESDNDEQYDAFTTNQPSILPQFQIESTYAELKVDESNSLHQSTSKTPDNNASDEQYRQPGVELNSNDAPIDMSADLGPGENNLLFGDAFTKYFFVEINSGTAMNVMHDDNLDHEQNRNDEKSLHNSNSPSNTNDCTAMVKDDNRISDQTDTVAIEIGMESTSTNANRVELETNDFDDLLDFACDSSDSEASTMSSILHRSTSKTPDINVNDEQYIQPDIELDSDDASIDLCALSDPKENELRVDKATQTDDIPSPQLPMTVDLISDHNDADETVNFDVNTASNEVENAVAGPSVPMIQRLKRQNDNIRGNRNKKRKSTQAVKTTKRHKCDQCKFSARKKCDLIIHNRTHSGERSFECEYCEKRFVRKAHLIDHIKSVHSNLFAFHCTKCRQGFTIEDSWKEHEMNCMKKQHICPLCNKNFYQHKGNFTEHMRWHSDKLPFDCSNCKKRFKTDSVLKRHVKSFHNKV